LHPSDYGFEDDSYTVGRAKIDDEKTILYMFNFTDCEEDICADADGKVSVFDLFEGKELGTFENEINLKKIPPHCAKVLICKRW
jgi:hypothetical protein